MAIKVFNNQKKIRFPAGRLLRLEKLYMPEAARMLRLTKDSAYNIILIDDAEIRKLNRKYLGKDRATDVMSFKYSPGNADIFISVETAKKNAATYSEEFFTELLRLCVHGILHALDYTDYVEQERNRLWKKQETILKCLISRCI
jgi:rRNA maturation RNase YbeY